VVQRVRASRGARRRRRFDFADYNDSVFVVQAPGWENALSRALELGRAQERDYENAEGQRVAWRLIEVLTLDQLGPTLVDGAEVHSSFHPGEPLPFETVFEPEASQPGHTGVPFST
jgi:hypothetical protein